MECPRKEYVRKAVQVRQSSEVGQTIALCRLSPNPVREVSAGEGHRGLARHDRPRKAMVCPTAFLQATMEPAASSWTIAPLTSFGKPIPHGACWWPTTRR